MKTNYLKVLGLSALTCLSALFMSVRQASAVNSDDAQTSFFDETANGSVLYGGANANSAIQLLFTGRTQSGAVAASTGAYVTISATAMTFYQPFGTVDSSVGTAGVITYASTLSSNQLGSLCDYINGLGYSYKCFLTNARRDDPPKVLKTQTATDGTANLAAVGGLAVLQTTTTYVSLGITPAKDRRVVLKQCVANGVMGAGDNGLTISGRLRKYGSGFDQFGTVADDTYNVWVSTLVSNTATTVPSSNALPRWIEFADNQHVVVRVGNVGANSVQTSANSIACSWDER